MKSRVYAWIPAWMLAFSLQGLGLVSLFFSDFLPGFRIPLVSGLAIAVHLPLLVLKPRRDIRGSIATGLASVVVLVFILSLVSSGVGNYGLWKLSVFICMSFVPVILLHRFYMGRSDIIRHFIGALAVFSFVSIFQLAQAVREYGLERFRWQLLQTGVDVIGLSRSMGIGAVLAIGYFFRSNGVWWKALMGGMALLMVVGQVLIVERGPLLACMFSIVYLAFANLRHNRSQTKQLPVILLVLVSLAFLAWKLPSLSERFTVDNLSLDARVDIYRKGIENMNKMNVLMGMGLGNFAYYSGAVGDSRQYVHNIFAELFLETGLSGLMVFVLYGYAIYRYAFGGKSTVRTQAAPVVMDTKALFIYSVLIAQVSGDLGTNYMIWVTGSLAICAVVATEIDLNRPVVLRQRQNAEAKSRQFGKHRSILPRSS